MAQQQDQQRIMLERFQREVRSLGLSVGEGRCYASDCVSYPRAAWMLAAQHRCYPQLLAGRFLKPMHRLPHMLLLTPLLSVC